MPTIPPFTGLAWVSSHPWLYPLLESLHVVGVALLVGNLVLLELRVWGRGAELPVMALARLALGISVAGFCLLAATGLLMFSAAPQELLGNRFFLIKMGLVQVAGLNALAFHLRHGLQKLDGVARAQTAFSLALWLAVIICGRWIAYA